MRSLRLLLLLLLPLAVAAAPSPFSALAIAKSSNYTVVCALVLPNATDAGVPYALNCTSFPDGKIISYPAAEIPYFAIAAGDGFLCGLMSPAGGSAAMRWWSFEEEIAENRSTPVGKRLYWGPSLRGLATGGSHVCGLSGGRVPSCWEWPDLILPDGINFTHLTLGANFMCGVSAPLGELQCIGDEPSVVEQVPVGRFEAIEAGATHACGVTVDGEFICWGAGAPALSNMPAEIRSIELGENRTCVLSGNGTVHCWGNDTAPPQQFAGEEFLAVEVTGDAICGVLAANYTVVCWGCDHFSGSNPVVFHMAMPGACTAPSACSCGVLPGSGDYCSDPGYAICNTCRMAISRVTINGSNVSGVGDESHLIELIIGVVGGAFIVALALCFTVYKVRSKKRVRTRPISLPTPRSLRSSRRVTVRLGNIAGAVAEKAFGCKEMLLRELAQLTDGFNEERRIGAGSFGAVYRATLPDGREVAIKRAEHRRTSRLRRGDVERAFRAERAVLSRVNHRNVVALLGYCEEKGERILVFEFMANGSLHDHLHGDCAGGGGGGRDSPIATSWLARLRIALDAARGIEYVHAYAVPSVIHRDIKPSNILIDSDWTAKVSDFGVSLVGGGGGAPEAPTGTAGTVGYIDPESYRLQELTERSDVYSFGVVLLELLTGHRAIERSAADATTGGDGDGEGDGGGSPHNVVELALPAVEAGELARVLDSRLAAPRGPEEEAVACVWRLAAECVRPRGRSRPTMRDVVAELEWAVGLCEDGLDQAIGRLSGRTERSDWDDPSPMDTCEIEIGGGSVVVRTDSRRAF